MCQPGVAGSRVAGWLTETLSCTQAEYAAAERTETRDWLVVTEQLQARVLSEAGVQVSASA
jgi:hypothetical protein